VGAAISVHGDALPGIYYGEIEARQIWQGKRTSPAATITMMPVSYVVATKPVPKDVPVVISPDARHGPEVEGALGLRPNGYVGGLSDMTSRYSAGDWRSYYFTVGDPTITLMSFKVSWPHNSTSVNAMAFGPDGRMLASSVPAGVFQEFAGWASNDWLGTSVVSEGGAFFFAQNGGSSGGNSTIMQVPINGTGTYSVLMHNTLFHGESLYEPIVVEAKFSTLLPDSTPPRIELQVPRFVPGERVELPLAVHDQNPAGSVVYFIDGYAQHLQTGKRSGIVIDGASLVEGPHLLRVESADTVGHSAFVEAGFTVDRTPPSARISVVRADGTTFAEFDYSGEQAGELYVSRGAAVTWNVTDANGVKDSAATLGNLTAFAGQSGSFVNDKLADGRYNFTITSSDEAGNKLDRTWVLVADSAPPSASLRFAAGGEQQLSGVARVSIDARDSGSGVKSAVLAVGNNVMDVMGMREYDLDTSGLADGPYKATLTVTDAAGNTSVATVAVVVANVTPLVLAAAAAGVAGGLAAGFVAALAILKKKGAGKS
jgi:hypothetical protein